jgi:hypothetical protein
LGIFVGLAIALATIAHTAKSDPVGHASAAYAAVYGVIPPFNR